MAGFLIIAAVILMVVGSVMLLIEAFGASMLWGLGTLLLPLPVGLIYVASHWHEAKRAFLVLVTGVGLFYMVGRAG